MAGPLVAFINAMEINIRHLDLLFAQTCCVLFDAEVICIHYLSVLCVMPLAMCHVAFVMILLKTCLLAKHQMDI